MMMMMRSQRRPPTSLPNSSSTGYETVNVTRRRRDPIYRGSQMYCICSASLGESSCVFHFPSCPALIRQRYGLMHYEVLLIIGSDCSKFPIYIVRVMFAPQVYIYCYLLYL